MIKRRTRERSFLELEALPPDLRDLARSCHPRLLAVTAGAGPPRPEPGLAPESALRLHPCRALSSAPVSTSVGGEGCFAKSVVVADREK
jgi:hypothetical protein